MRHLPLSQEEADAIWVAIDDLESVLLQTAEIWVTPETRIKDIPHEYRHLQWIADQLRRVREQIEGYRLARASKPHEDAPYIQRMIARQHDEIDRLFKATMAKGLQEQSGDYSI